MTDQSVADWFLSPDERGNPWTCIDRMGDIDGSWVEGNLVRPLIHGATYFDRLYDELCALRPADRVYFTDWRGDSDEKLRPDGPTIGTVLADLARSGVEVRALLWRSHSDHLQFNARENRRLGTKLNEAGAEVLLDQRVRTASRCCGPMRTNIPVTRSRPTGSGVSPARTARRSGGRGG